jgi:ATP-dependent DNA ligase
MWKRFLSVCEVAHEASDLVDTARSGEGLVVKNPRSTYILNGREDAWIKVKPDYMTNVRTVLHIKWT